MTAEPFLGIGLTHKPKQDNDVLSRELGDYRTFAQKRIGEELLTHTAKTVYSEQVAAAAAATWQLYKPTFIRNVAPGIVDAFREGMRQVSTGQVPEQLLVPLAEKYAEHIGDYFNESSSEALIEGFNAYVNKKVPRKLAMERALEAFGLNKKQTRALVASDLLDGKKINSVMNIDVRRKAIEFISRAILDRFSQFDREEIFKAQEHSKQLVWMWEGRAGRLPEGSKRQWVTAKDEKVCKICGPLHNKKVSIERPFKTEKGEIWTPGMHVNCRCSVRLWVPMKSREQNDPFTNLSKAATLIGTPEEGDDDQPFDVLHPRGARGRFVTVADRPVAPNPLLDDLAALEEATEKQKKTPPLSYGDQSLSFGARTRTGSTTPYGAKTDAPLSFGTPAPTPTQQVQSFGADPDTLSFGTGQLSYQPEAKPYAGAVAESVAEAVTSVAGFVDSYERSFLRDAVRAVQTQAAAEAAAGEVLAPREPGTRSSFQYIDGPAFATVRINSEDDTVMRYRDPSGELIYVIGANGQQLPFSHEEWVPDDFAGQSEAVRHELPKWSLSSPVKFGKTVKIGEETYTAVVDSDGEPDDVKADIIQARIEAFNLMNVRDDDPEKGYDKTVTLPGHVTLLGGDKIPVPVEMTLTELAGQLGITATRRIPLEAPVMRVLQVDQIDTGVSDGYTSNERTTLNVRGKFHAVETPQGDAIVHVKLTPMDWDL